MSNLFNKAKKSAPAKTTKGKEEKLRLTVEDANFFTKVQKLEELNESMKIAKAKADMISDEIRDVAKEAWVEEYERTGKNPESVIICQESGLDVAQLMFIPTDRYITITEARAEELKETYGEDIVTEETTFGFDSAMIEKYGEILSRLIEECDDISDRDKERIITAKTSYTVAKGTIDVLPKYGSVNEMVIAVKPVVSLKNIEVIKG